jgi:hypothetical protein
LNFHSGSVGRFAESLKGICIGYLVNFNHNINRRRGGASVQTPDCNCRDKGDKGESEKVSLHGILPSVNIIVLPCDLHWDVTGITESNS